MVKPDMAIVLLNPGFNGTANLSNINLLTLTGYAVSVLRDRSFWMGQR
jgi:hypothetical protein